MAQRNSHTAELITEFEKHYGVPEGSFDNVVCPKEHIIQIAEIIDCWEQLAPFLDLTNPDIKGIKKDHVGNDQLQRRAALMKWKQRNGHKATYANLLAALCKSNRMDIASEVCDLLTPHLKEFDVESKLVDLQKLLDEVQSVLASNPKALDKTKGLRLADHLTSVANNIRNIYDQPPVVGQSLLTPFQLPSKLSTPPQSVPNDFIDGESVIPTLVQEPNSHGVPKQDLVLQSSAPVQLAAPMRLEPKQNIVLQSSAPVQLAAPMLEPNQVSVIQPNISVAQLMDLLPKAEPKQVLQPTVMRENSATSLESRKRRIDDAQSIVSNAKKPKSQQKSCGVHYKSSDEGEIEFSKNAKMKIERELKIKGHQEIFHCMVQATVHRFDCEHCNECETFKIPVNLD